MRITDLLRSIDLFEQLSSDELDELANRMQDRQLRAHDVLCREGNPVEGMVIVVGGSVEVKTGGPDTASPGIQLGPGEVFGDTALLSGEVHHATATAVTDCRVLELQKDDFEALVSTRPRLMRAMLAAVSRRAVQTNQRLLADQPGAARGPLSPASTGRIYPVFSPRGGSGKTTLAVRLATRLAELSPQRVALLDLDLFSDDAALQLNLTPAASLASIREAELAGLDPRSLGNYLVEHESRLRVLVGATSPEEGERVTGAHVRAALAALRRQFLVTIVDCGSTFSEPTLAALEAGDRVLVVCTPELATLRDVRDCQRIFGQALHIDKTKLAYIFNHPLPAAGLTRVQFEAALEQPMSHEIPHAGELASKPVFAKAVGQLVAELRPPESAADGTSGGTTDRKGRARPARAGLLRLWGAHAR